MTVYRMVMLFLRFFFLMSVFFSSVLCFGKTSVNCKGLGSSTIKIVNFTDKNHLVDIVYGDQCLNCCDVGDKEYHYEILLGSNAETTKSFAGSLIKKIHLLNSSAIISLSNYKIKNHYVITIKNKAKSSFQRVIDFLDEIFRLKLKAGEERNHFAVRQIFLELGFVPMRDFNGKFVFQLPSPYQKFLVKISLKNVAASSNVSRVSNAQAVMNMIQDKCFEYLIVAQKYLYHVPTDQSYELNDDNYWVLCKKIEIDASKSLLNCNNEAIDQLLFMTRFLELTDLGFKVYGNGTIFFYDNNIGITSDGKIALLDLEDVILWRRDSFEGLVRQIRHGGYIGAIPHELAIGYVLVKKLVFRDKKEYFLLGKNIINKIATCFRSLFPFLVLGYLKAYLYIGELLNEIEILVKEIKRQEFLTCNEIVKREVAEYISSHAMSIKPFRQIFTEDLRSYVSN